MYPSQIIVKNYNILLQQQQQKRCLQIKMIMSVVNRYSSIQSSCSLNKAPLSRTMKTTIMTTSPGPFPYSTATNYNYNFNTRTTNNEIFPIRCFSITKDGEDEYIDTKNDDNNNFAEFSIDDFGNDNDNNHKNENINNHFNSNAEINTKLGNLSKSMTVIPFHNNDDNQAPKKKNNNDQNKKSNTKKKSTTAPNTKSKKFKNNSFSLLNFHNELYKPQLVEEWFDQELATRLELSTLLQFIKKLERGANKQQQHQHQKDKKQSNRQKRRQTRRPVVHQLQSIMADLTSPNNKLKNSSNSSSTTTTNKDDNHDDNKKSQPPKKQSTFKIPKWLVTSFWDFLKTKSTNEKKQNKTKSTKTIKEQHVALLKKMRQYTVMNTPLFWSRSERRRLILQFKSYQQQHQDLTLHEFIHQNHTMALQNIHLSKSQEQLDKEALELATHLQQVLPPKYFNALMKLFADHVEEADEEVESNQNSDIALGDDMENKDQDDDIDNDDVLTNNIVLDSSLKIPSTIDRAINDDISLSTKKQVTKGKKQKQRMQMIFTHVQKATQTHVHLVATELAQFFYLTMPKGFSPSNNISFDSSVDLKNQDDNDTSNITMSPSKLSTTTIITTTASSDPRVITSRKNWNEARSKFVDSFLTIQSKLIEEVESLKESTESNIVTDQQGSADIVPDKESLVSSVLEGSKQQEQDAKRQAKKDSLKIVKRRYIKLDALTIDNLTWDNSDQPTMNTSIVKENDTDNSATTTTGAMDTSLPYHYYILPTAPPSDRMVFIDNLPIDITQKRLEDVYGRFGSIDYLQIFNQRLDYDPGSRKSDINKKKIRKPMSKGRRSWIRPRTPLYGMILYNDPQGYQTASSDPLRIFGLVLDNHMIRSYPTKDMNQLYLEYIPQGLDADAVEYQLSQILRPELYVCLDVDQRRKLQNLQSTTTTRGKRNNATIASNCQIQFADFDAAYSAYIKLNSQLEWLVPSPESTTTTSSSSSSSSLTLDTIDSTVTEEPCTIHWMPTPADAMLYWTRKLNF